MRSREGEGARWGRRSVGSERCACALAAQRSHARMGRTATLTPSLPPSAHPPLLRYDEWFDPTVMSDRMATPWSDVRFRGHLRGRPVPALAMHMRGFKLVAHPHAFVVHRAHDKSRASLLYDKVGSVVVG